MSGAHQYTSCGRRKREELISEMQLLAVCAVLAAAAVPGALAAVDLNCECRVRQHKDWTYALHCTREQGGESVASCEKAKVPGIPPDYHYVPGYALIRLYRTFKSWAAAKKTCEEEGSQLAVPPDRYAYDGLKQIFPKEKGIWYAYLGITDQASEGVFAGVDGRPAPYLPWQANEPNNANGAKEEDCVDVRNDGLLNDVACGNPSPFFCERRLQVRIPDGYTWLGDAGRFYKVHAKKEIHAEAVKVCHSENATLAVTDTWSRALALLRTLQPNDDSYLVGFTDEAVEGDFVTETGRHLKDMEFKEWGDTQPVHGRSENCLALSGKGEYNDVRCDSALPFICEIVPT